MFFRKSKKEDKNLISITSEQYCIILAQIILTSGDSYKDFCKNINKEEDFQDYLIYLQYLLYISQKLLEKKYSIDKVNYFIN